jgi:hypothetical protein
MDIQITISTKGNHPELYRDLFGLGEEVKDPEILKILESKEEKPRYTNKSAIIMEGVTLSEAPGRQYRVAESLETQFVDHNFILQILGYVGLGERVYKITNWLIDKLENYDCKIKIGNKEVRNKDEFQKTLEDYFNENS